MIGTRQLSHRVAQLRINGMRKALILACALATIATPALAVDQAKVAVLEAQMRADEQTAIQAADKAEAAAKLVLQTKDRHEAFQLSDKVIEQTDIASEGDSAWFDQCLSAPRGSTRAAR
jgi:ABC-type Fe3+/spermidine/putrescine transport system ATPase subunit